MKILPIPARCGAVRLAAVLLLALSCTAVLASGHIVDVAWDPSGRFNHSATVPPGKFVEVCGRLDSGMKVRWEFDAVAPMDFNIHYHVGKDAVFPAKQAQVARAGDLLVAGTTEDYCWMWTNKSQRDLFVRVVLQH